MIGPELAKNYPVYNHAGRDDESHLDLGETRRGTPIQIDRRYLEADLKILTGLVEPHLMAGYSGGRKVICPGIASWRTIRRLHSPAFLEHPRCAAGFLEGNPLHEEQLEIVRMLGHVLAVNTVIDEHRRLSFVNFGEIVSSHQQAVDFTQRYARVPLHRRFKTVVTSAAAGTTTTTTQCVNAPLPSTSTSP